MSRPLYRWDQTNPAQKALQQGQKPYSGTLGRFPESEFDDPRKNMWRARLLDNPKARGFSTRAQFPDDIAAQSQQKLYDSSLSPYSSFEDPNVRLLADKFLDGYSAAIGTILNPDEAVTPEQLRARYFLQQPTDGNSGLFPGRNNGVA